MAKISRRRAHGRSLDQAKAGLIEAMRMLVERVPGAGDPQFHPDGTRATLDGMAFAAKFHVDETHVHIEVDLSFPANLMRGKVEAEMDKHLDKHFPAAG